MPRRDFYLAGNYLEGPLMGACVERAFRVVGEVENHLSGVA